MLPDWLQQLADECTPEELATLRIDGEKMKVEYKGQEATIRKEEFYCKAGAYEHRKRIGWVVEVDGKIVLGDRKYASNRCAGADRHDYPEFRTRKEALWAVEQENEAYARKAAKQAAKEVAAEIARF